MSFWRTAAGTARPQVATSVAVFIALTLGYAGVIVALDAWRNVAGGIGEVAAALPYMILASLLAYVVRAARYRWLLARLGYATTLAAALPAYVTGFAFTATPGKIGELVRARYFSRLSVPPAAVVACFVFERTLDLLVLLAFACLIAGSGIGFGLALVFVALVVAAVTVATRLSVLLRPIQHRLRTWGRLARLVRIFAGGLGQLRAFFSGRDLAVAAAFGVVAWALQCTGFLAAMRTLGVDLPLATAFAIPPLSMLVGAASMMPGGIGSTEAATTIILRGYSVDLDLCVRVAIGLRLGSIWFAMLVGLTSITFLEHRAGKGAV